MEATTNNIRPKFGERTLDNIDNVYQHNAWDNVQWDEEFKAEVMTKIEANSEKKVDEERSKELEMNANEYWDRFYEKHENKFFKDRHWLFTEFEELLPQKEDNSEEAKECKIILELGCGVGNTVFPLLNIDNSERLFIYCCDFSEKAISILKDNPLYDTKRCHAFQFDLTNEKWQLPFKESSLSIVTAIFVLSAIDPSLHQNVINNIIRYLKPGGKILFRDYGHLDLTQVRFKSGQCIKDNFYVRGDGTRSYFFTPEQIHSLFTNSGLKKLHLHTDRRLQVNRANKKKMYRVWIQAKYVKEI